MRIIRTVKSLRAAVFFQRRKGRRIGLVPTMGALHEGHLSLIRLAKRRSDFVVVSIFVNPAQFGPREDLKKYPRDLRGDTEKCRKAGADLIFVPSVKEVYTEGFSTYVNVEGITQGLCGASRPGHFRGVATVVCKLFNMVRPDVAAFGQKDAQQAAVIRRMVRDLDMDIDIVIGPIIREPDGLAMSSRNAYLTTAERSQAPALYHSLVLARSMARHGIRETSKVKREMAKLLAREAPLGNVDYIEIVNNETLEPLKRISGKTLVALAVRFPGARLIDNTVIG
jgi:pantoate--beta-alanine ligase